MVSSERVFRFLTTVLMRVGVELRSKLETRPGSKAMESLFCSLLSCLPLKWPCWLASRVIFVAIPKWSLLHGKIGMFDSVPDPARISLATVRQKASRLPM